MIDHSPYTRAGSGPNAVLLIHGIAGSPGHFRDLIPVIPEEFSICNILLEGHSGSVENFSRSSMKKWKSQIQFTLSDLLDRHEKVVIVAHSMGTLFAIQAAIDHPGRIPRLFLLAVPTRPCMRISTLLTCLQVAFGKMDTPAAQAMYHDTALEVTPKLWKYLGWAPRMAELLWECRRVRKLLPQLTTPTQVFQSQTDELVSKRSCSDLIHPYIHLTVLEDSGHFAYGQPDTLLLQTQLLETLEAI